MKVFVATLFLLILGLAAVSTFEGQPRSPVAINLSASCCLKYSYEEKALSRKLVVGYRKALSCNRQPVIIFVTKKNREFCTNPSKEWVQDYIKDPNLPLLPPKTLPPVRSI